MKVALPNGSMLFLSEESYAAVSDYVRKEDRLQHVKDVLSNNLTCNDSKMKNLEDFVVSDEARLNTFVDALYNKLESDQGEKEYLAVDELIEQYEIAVYRIISNKDTDEEQEDKAVLPKELADKLPANNNLTVWSICGEYLDSSYIDEVVYDGPYIEN